MHTLDCDRAVRLCVPPTKLHFFMATQRDKLIWCCAGNALALAAVVVSTSVLSSGGNYWRVGPSDSLVILDVKIDTFRKYCALLVFIAFIKATEVISNDVGQPILSFNIFDPHKKHISEFTKLELQLFGNAVYLMGSVRAVFMVMITIAQIDIALVAVLIAELASVYTIRLLLNEKKFKGDPGYEPIEMDDIVVVQQ